MRLKWIAAGLMVTMAGVAGAQELTAAGSTFVYPILNRWAGEYKQAHPNVKINYQSIGSGGGILQASNGTVDFGATDVAMTDEQIAAAKVKTFHLPIVMGAVVLTYNLPGVTQELKFSPDVIADIYLGHITKWNDGRIAKDNPGVNLPDKPILPVYRSDGSGTTGIFTDYLSKVSPEWKSKVGMGGSVHWPVGIGQKGNENVAGMVRQTPGSFGYVELIYATVNKMAFGLVKNAAGQYIRPSTGGITAAAASYVSKIPNDYRVSITNAPGATSYPICGFTWLLIPNQIADHSKAAAIKDFLTWVLDHGEAEAAGMSYAPLPQALADRVRKSVGNIK
ncbi:MAG TPA: phosphate ABC transporter substrate-binding protein PstS [Acidobacteriaceae bacterium]|nr:phosphate ABC transporter substrate-binding protein PstS [Acidobacteriaceae bacterium]